MWLQLHYSTCDTQLSQHHLLKRLFLSNVHFWHLCPKSPDRGVWFHSGSSRTSTYMSILMSESAALSPGSCAGIWNQMLIVIPPAFSAQECSGYLAFSVLHMNFSDFFFSFCKDCYWNFDGGIIKCVISFRIKIVFIILILPVHEHMSTFCFL